MTKENSFNLAARSSDEADPLPPICRPRGKGGVATFWHPKLDSIAEPLQDGGPRIQVVKFAFGNPNIYIINAYLPSEYGKLGSEESYESILDEVREITEKYAKAGRVLLVGDLNGDFNRKKYDRDWAIAKFCNTASFVCPDNYPDVYTYMHRDGRNSQIDHIRVQKPI